MKLASSVWLLALLLTPPLAAETVQVGTDRASGNTIISTGGRRTEAIAITNTNLRIPAGGSIGNDQLIGGRGIGI